MQEKVLSVKGLTTSFQNRGNWRDVISDVSFDLLEGDTLSIVGESGCGKSVTSLSIIQLLPRKIAKVSAGEIIYEGQNILALNNRELRKLRGNGISMIFQDSITGLNPVVNIGNQVIEAIRAHQSISYAGAKEKAMQILEKVGIPSPKDRFKSYPHELSGGMRQRVSIGIALANSTRVLIADEPTTALDVTVQKQILDLIDELKEEYAMSVILITHDLGVVSERSDRIVVMYAGQIVEQASREDLFNNSLHPYSQGLLKSRPSINKSREEKLDSIPGMVPSVANFPSGCRFHDRCAYCQEKCRQEAPPTVNMGNGHMVRCWRYE